MKLTVILAGLVLLVALACTPSPSASGPVGAPDASPSPPPTPELAPTLTALPLPSPEPSPTHEPTDTPLPTNTPTRVPTATPDISAMVDQCELDRAQQSLSNLLLWSEPNSGHSTTPDDLGDLPDSCVEFRDRSPEDYVRLIGHSISGRFVLHDDDLFVLTRAGALQGSCWGQGGYDDISSGLEVVVKNADGSIIAKDELWNGKSTGYNECTFPFLVENIRDSEFYVVGVGKRGSLTFSRAELELDNWQVNFVLGNRY